MPTGHGILRCMVSLLFWLRADLAIVVSGSGFGGRSDPQQTISPLYAPRSLRHVVLAPHRPFTDCFLPTPGTADSTRPSPPPQPKRKLHPTDADIHPGGDSPNPLPVPAHSDSYYSHGSTLTIPASFTTYGNSRWDPASPRTLARLLADVPPRETPSPSPLSASEEPDAASESEVSSPTVGGSSGSDSDQGCLTSLPDHMDEPLTARAVVPHPLTKFVEDEAETGALRDGIRGLWKLWETGRRKRSAYGGTDSDKELFLEIVKDVISLS